MSRPQSSPLSSFRAETRCLKAIVASGLGRAFYDARSFFYLQDILRPCNPAQAQRTGCGSVPDRTAAAAGLHSSLGNGFRFASQSSPLSITKHPSRRGGACHAVARPECGHGLLSTSRVDRKRLSAGGPSSAAAGGESLTGRASLPRQSLALEPALAAETDRAKYAVSEKKRGLTIPEKREPDGCNRYEQINEASSVESRHATATPDQQRRIGQSVCVTSRRYGLVISCTETQGEAAVARGLASPFHIYGGA